MPAASARAAQPTRQFGTAATASLPGWKTREERIASLLQTHLGYGAKTALCCTLGLKAYQLSKQFAGGEARLSFRVIDVGVALLEQDEGKATVVAEIRTLMVSGGSVARLDPMTIVFDPRKGTVEWGYR